MIKKLFLVALVLLMIQCREKGSSSYSADTEGKYLPDLSLLYEDYESLDSTKAYSKFANRIIEENRDLQSSQMYIEAALIYDKDGKLDTIVSLIHLAINHGMANPNILQKFSSIDTIPQTLQWKRLQFRLDSIHRELKELSHFGIEVGSMQEFWPYYNKALEDTASARVIFKEYIFEGPREIRDFYYARYESPNNMYGQMINGTPDYYKYLENYLKTDSLTRLNEQTTQWMSNFREYYPQAVFPKVYMVPGILNTGGTVTEMGMFVGGDMYGRSEEMPTNGMTEWQKGAIMRFSDLPGLIMHELMHFQQGYKDEENGDTVLMQIIGEGACDFLVELSSGRPNQHSNLKYLEDQENREFILEELRRDLFITDNSRWLYNGGSIEDRPHDMGYTMGYLISKSYYNNQEDKLKAVHELLNTSDVVAILKASEYAFLLEPKTTEMDPAK